MKKNDELALFSMVLNNVDNMSTGQVVAVIDLMKVKTSIENDNLRSALLGLLEFVLREADLGPVQTIDDLTKLLNTGGEGFESARALINKEGN